MISSLSPDVAGVAAMMTIIFRKSCFLFMREPCHAAGGGLTDSRNRDRIKLPARAEGRTQTRRRLLLHLRKEVRTMRITFHIGRYTVTIIVYERKKSNRHSGK